MANFDEMSGIKQWAAAGGRGAGSLPVALYFTVFKSQREANAAAQANLDAKLRENAELESYRPKLAEIERQLASLKQQLEIERKIVPDEKEVPGFMKMMDAEAVKAGIELRRYTAKPAAAKEFYTEVPFEMELDGPYYSMLNFFDQRGQAGAHRQRLGAAGGNHQEAHRRQGEAHLSVRAQRERCGDLHGDHILQS